PAVSRQVRVGKVGDDRLQCGIERGEILAERGDVHPEQAGAGTPADVVVVETRLLAPRDAGLQHDAIRVITNGFAGLVNAVAVRVLPDRVVYIPVAVALQIHVGHQILLSLDLARVRGQGPVSHVILPVVVEVHAVHAGAPGGPDRGRSMAEKDRVARVVLETGTGGDDPGSFPRVELSVAV